MTGAGFASCSQPIPSYTVMGSIPDSTFNGKTVYIFDRDKGQNIDSAVIENGAFTFTGQIDTAVLCLTQVGRKYYTTFMLENGTIQLNMETPNSASGTPLNETFSSYIQEEKRISELFQNKMKEIREQEQDKSKVQELTKTYYDNEYKPAYMATPSTWNPLSLYWLYTSASIGVSARQGPHQLAQKSTNTTLPLPT